MADTEVEVVKKGPSEMSNLPEMMPRPETRDPRMLNDKKVSKKAYEAENKNDDILARALNSNFTQKEIDEELAILENIQDDSGPVEQHPEAPEAPTVATRKPPGMDNFETKKGRKRKIQPVEEYNFLIDDKDNSQNSKEKRKIIMERRRKRSSLENFDDNYDLAAFSLVMDKHITKIEDVIENEKKNKKKFKKEITKIKAMNTKYSNRAKNLKMLSKLKREVGVDQVQVVVAVDVGEDGGEERGESVLEPGPDGGLVGAAFLQSGAVEIPSSPCSDSL